MQKLWRFIQCFSFLQDHVEDIKKTHLRDLLSNEERSKSMTVYVTYFMKLYSLTIWYFILHYDVITFWILHSLKWIWWNSIGLLKAAGHPWNNGKTLQIGWGQFSHLYNLCYVLAVSQSRSFKSKSYLNWNVIIWLMIIVSVVVM